MLRQRIITATVLLLLCSAILYWANLLEFAFLTALLMAVAAKEWAELVDIHHPLGVGVYIFLSLLLLLGCAYLPSLFSLLFSVLLWLGLIGVVYFAAAGRVVFWVRHTRLSAITGLLLIASLWVAMNTLFSDPQGRLWLFYGLSVIWVVDSAAYFCGRAFGKRLLCPRVSPKKTWEGVAGGLAAVGCYSLLGAWFLGIPKMDWGYFVGFSLLSGIFSIFGDLYESVLKRHANVKDSGQLLPGHGGLLDRIDGLLAGLPIIALALMSLA